MSDIIKCRELFSNSANYNMTKFHLPVLHGTEIMGTFSFAMSFQIGTVDDAYGVREASKKSW